MITVSHLFKDFVTPEGDWTYAVKDVSFHVSRGEVVGIIGSSGSGKSVLLRCMAGLEQPTSGEVTLSPGVKVGMVFQQFNLFGHLSVLDNVTLAPMKLLGLGREEAEELAMEMLRHVGMAEHARHTPASLSGGQQQRAAIARTLAMKPEILLMDEPTSSLDPTMVDEVQGVVRSLAQEGMTMVIVTHEMRFARDTSSRILFIHNGSLLEDGTPSQIFNEPRLPETRSFVNRIRHLAFDLYDFQILNGHLLFCVGDVSGKGVPASLMMAVTRSLFHTVCGRTTEPEEIMNQMNAAMSEMNENSIFVTFFIGNLDLKTGILSYSNAAHCPPVLVNETISTLQMDSNIPLGVMEWDYTRQEIHVGLDSVIFLYTDGLTEAENTTHGQFGEARMLAELEKMSRATPRELIDHISEAVQVFESGTEQSDDLTMLAIRYTKTSK